MSDDNKKLPAGWEVKRLGDVAEIFNGLWTGKKPPFVNVGVIRNTNFKKNGELDDSDIVFLDVEKSQFDKRKLQFGDIILEKSGGGPKQPVGRVVMFNKKEGDFSFSNFTSAIRPNGDVINYWYLHMFLFFCYINNITEKMQSHSTGIRNLKLDEYKSILIPYPDIKEQKRIVAILDESFRAIDEAKKNAEKNLANARELFEGYLNQIFANPGEDWEEKKLGEVCEFVRGPFGGSLKKGIFKKDGYAVYEQQHAIYNQFTNIRYFIDETKFQEMKRFELKSGDLIMSCSGTMGKMAIVPEKIKKGIINQALLKLSPKGNMSVDYLKLWMTSDSFQQTLKKYSQGAAIQNVASVKILKEIYAPVPSMIEQKKIMSEIKDISQETKRLELIYQQKLANLDELKKSILQKAFSGEL